MTTLRLILGDQLSHDISSLSDYEDGDIIWMCELWDEATYVKHHKKKIAFIFSAMRHFAMELGDKYGAASPSKKGQPPTPTRVTQPPPADRAQHSPCLGLHYIKLNESEELGCKSFRDSLKHAIDLYAPEKIIVTEPGEHRLLQDMQTWEKDLGVPIEIRPDTRFLATHAEFQNWAKGRKQLRMEFFYREMRKKYGILMNGDKPEGGEWNYDSQNRKTPGEHIEIPAPYNAQIDDITRECIALVAERFADHFGDLEPFYFAVTRDQALYALDKFITERLAKFGDYQDAMLENEPWLFHSHLSFYINIGLLNPLECCERAEAAYAEGTAPLNAVEGFIRQILGWREYVRGIYWLKMPTYESENFLSATRPLPWLFWGGQTKMNCLAQCVKETKENAYAHHIQRLMILGNFALIAGLDPDEVNDWYMVVYADAYQWVELPNVTGMILFADGGLLASKPYAASGAYINKMSDYCKNCSYAVTKKNGPKACPFNYLYWDFMIRNEDKLRNNPRLGFSYKTLDNMVDEKINAIKDDSQRFFKNLKEGTA